MSMRDDELIDRAAHALTRGEPSPQLRQAVRARIDAVSPGLFAAGTRGTTGLAFGSRDQPWPVWIAVAAAAVLVISVVLARTVSGPRAAPLTSRQIASAYQATPPVVLQPSALALSGPIITRTTARAGRAGQQNPVL